MKKLILPIFSILLLSIACQFSPKESGETIASAVEEEVKKVVNTEEVAIRPAPTSHIGAVPIYDTFEDIADIFNQKSDTTYVVNFWATWCKPCVAELPYFEKIVDEYQDEKVQVILVSLDFKKQLESKLLPFLAERKLQSEVVVLADGKYNNWIDKVDADWGGAIPATVIYNAQKRSFFGEQFANYEELNELVQEMM
ncbi:MAG: redoxin domain-containing protein [Saprospiraceae bacterium]